MLTSEEPRLHGIERADSVYPQRHPVLCPRQANLRGCVCRQARCPTLALPILHRQSLCLHLERGRWQGLPGTTPPLRRDPVAPPPGRHSSSGQALTKYLNRSLVPSSTVSPQLCHTPSLELSASRTIIADVLPSQIRYRQASPDPERPAVHQQQPEARSRGRRMSHRMLPPPLSASDKHMYETDLALATSG